VRQLENVIKRAVIMAEGTTIGAADLELPDGEENGEALNLRVVREAAERMALLKAMGRANGNLSKAAEWLGISRPTLYDLMHRYGLK
jgi:two-component system NtrC family response regulator